MHVGERRFEERILRRPYHSDASLSKITPTSTCLKPPFSTVACSGCGCPPITNGGWGKAELNVSRREKGLSLLFVQVHLFLGPTRPCELVFVTQAALLGLELDVNHYTALRTGLFRFSRARCIFKSSTRLPASMSVRRGIGLLRVGVTLCLVLRFRESRM